MKKLVLSCIRGYQKLISSETGIFSVGLNTCRFTPTCSEYSYQAISKYGILHGSFLAFRRLLRCHPGNPGGLDPVV